MKRKEIKAKVTDLIASGVAKTEVFANLTGQGVKDRVLAHVIASHVDHQRCEANRTHILVVRIFSYLQLVLAVSLGFVAGHEISMLAGLIVAGVGAAFALLFVWGFATNHAGAYNAYLILTIIQLPRQITGFAENPVATVISLLLGGAVFAYILYVRNKLFPDFAFIAPRKVNGAYVFSD